MFLIPHSQRKLMGELKIQSFHTLFFRCTGILLLFAFRHSIPDLLTSLVTFNVITFNKPEQ